MLNRLPTAARLPSLALILEDLDNPSPRRLARALGVTPRTVRRWIAREAAPRSATLALFSVTSWRQSEIACDAHAAMLTHRQLARSLASEVEQLHRELARLASLRFGAANDATRRARPTMWIVR